MTDPPRWPPDHPTDAALNDLLDGRLPLDSRTQVEAHLGGCARCQADYDALAAVVTLGARMRGLGTVPPDVWPQVAAATIHARAVRRHVLRSLRLPLVVGGLALAAASAWLGMRAERAMAARGGSVPTARPTIHDGMEVMEERRRRAKEKAEALAPARP